MNKKVLVIGAGRIGGAIGKILEKKHIQAEFFDADPSKVPGQKPLNETVPVVDMIFLCVPSWGIRDAVKAFGQYLADKTIIVFLAKGIEEKTYKRADELLSDLLPKQRHVLISGPMLAEELATSLSGRGVCVSLHEPAASEVRDIFSNTNLVLEHSTDIRSIALAGVLKNIYAVGLGIADALEMGSNFKGWYVGQVLMEMSGIIEAFGGDGRAAYSCAGLGDLVATGFSPHSRNRGVGESLIKEGSAPKGEGTVSLPSVISMLGIKAQTFPVLMALKKIILEKKNAKSEFLALHV
jgi:glycerol-3-phosphate dehydrogenase (NAD(P)+)